VKRGVAPSRLSASLMSRPTAVEGSTPGYRPITLEVDARFGAQLDHRGATFRVNDRPKREAESGCELPRWFEGSSDTVLTQNPIEFTAYESVRVGRPPLSDQARQWSPALGDDRWVGPLG